MYNKTFQLENKRNYKKIHRLLESVMIDNGININLVSCKKANRITVTGDSSRTVYKALRTIGITPMEYMELAVR